MRVQRGLWTSLLQAGLILLNFIGTGAFADPSTPVHLVRTPEGGLQPQAAVDSQGNVHLVFLAGDPKAADVMYSVRKRGETAFGPPVQVNHERGDAIALGTVRGVQLALGRNDRVHVVWNGSQPARDKGAKGAPMLYTRLADGGVRFEPERNLMTATMNLDGGGSVAADPRGNVYVVWHAHARTGPDDETHRAVYLARSTDDGATFGPERKLNVGEAGVCGCCGLKTFADERGQLAILYRSADEVGNRDSMLLVSQDHGNSFESTLLGAWRSSTCPMSTPALGVGPEKTLLAMWETQGQVFYRALTAGHLSSAAPASAPDNSPGDRKHPVFALSSAKNSRLLMAWVEGTGWEKGGALVWECLDLQTKTKSTGRQSGVPAWDRATAFPEPDGTFTIVY